MTYWKPMYVWTMIMLMKAPSSSGLNEPAAKGATVIGMRAADKILHAQHAQSALIAADYNAHSKPYLSNVQW